jgi:hypothetical protein
MANLFAGEEPPQQPQQETRGQGLFPGQSPDSLIDVFKQSKNDPSRFIKNVLAGSAEFGKQALNLPSNIEGLLSPDTARVPRMQDYNYPEMLGIKGDEQGDYKTREYAHDLPALIGGGALVKKALPYVKQGAQIAAPYAKKGAEALAERGKQAYEASKEFPSNWKKLNEVERLAEQAKKSNIQGGIDKAEAGQNIARQEDVSAKAQIAFAKQIANQKEPAMTGLEKATKELQGKIPSDVIESKRGIVTKLRDVFKNEIEGPLNKGYNELELEPGSSGTDAIPYEYLPKQKGSPALLEGTTTKDLLQKATLAEDAFKYADTALESLKDFQWKDEDFNTTLEEMDAGTLSNYTKERKHAMGIIKKAMKVPTPTIKDAMLIFRNARKEAIHLNRMASSDRLSPVEANNLREGAKELERISKEYEEAMRKSWSPDQNERFDKLQADWRDLAIPFNQESFLTKAIKGHGSLKTNDVFSALAKSGRDRLANRLLGDETLLDLITKHDMRAQDVTNPAALKKFFEKRGQNVPKDLRQISEIAYELSKDLETLKEVEGIINSGEVNLTANMPEIRRLFKRMPHLEKYHSNNREEKVRLDDMKAELYRMGLNTKQVDANLAAYESEIKDLEAKTFLGRALVVGTVSAINPYLLLISPGTPAKLAREILQSALPKGGK